MTAQIALGMGREHEERDGREPRETSSAMLDEAFDENGADPEYTC